MCSLVHLVEAQQQIHEGVPRRYYADLPKLANETSRVYIAWASVAHTGSVLTRICSRHFLTPGKLMN
jgi:cyclic beta-1,2-glucan synthetase